MWLWRTCLVQVLDTDEAWHTLVLCIPHHLGNIVLDDVCDLCCMQWWNCFILDGVCYVDFAVIELVEWYISGPNFNRTHVKACFWNTLLQEFQFTGSMLECYLSHFFFHNLVGTFAVFKHKTGSHFVNFFTILVQYYQVVFGTATILVVTLQPY